MAVLGVRADIVVHAPNGSLVLLVEVKNRERLSSEVATTFRRNMVVHGMLDARLPYFMIVSQDNGFVWDQRKVAELDAAPTADFSMLPIVDRYLPAPAGRDRLRGSVLDFIVANWLIDVSQGTSTLSDEPDRVLVDIGVANTIRGATVALDPES